MNKKNVLILHGWNAGPDSNWFQKAKTEWNDLNVIIPEMPGGYFPKVGDWVNIIKEYQPDKNWILMGHSLGGVAILRYLETTKNKVGKIILIASPYEPMKFDPIANFFKDLDCPAINKNCSKIDLVYESDDPAVPYEHGENYEQKLKGKLYKLSGGTHFHFIDLKFIKGLIDE